MAELIELSVHRYDTEMGKLLMGYNGYIQPPNASIAMQLIRERRIDDRLSIASYQKLQNRIEIHLLSSLNVTNNFAVGEVVSDDINDP